MAAVAEKQDDEEEEEERVMDTFQCWILLSWPGVSYSPEENQGKVESEAKELATVVA